VKEEITFIKERTRQSGEPFWIVLADNVWYTLWEELKFKLGDIVEFDVLKEDGQFNPEMVNCRKVADSP
jgi:hypothetical protein